MKVPSKIIGEEGTAECPDSFKLGEPHQDHLMLLKIEMEHANRLPVKVHDGWLITSGGSVSSDRCGTLASAYHKLGAPVKDKKNWRAFVYYCHRQGCPKCNEVWSHRAGDDAAINLYMKAALSHSYLHHDVVSWTYAHYEEAKASAEFYNSEHKADDDFKPRDVWFYLEARLSVLVNFLHKGSSAVGYCYVHHPYHLACGQCGERLDKENNDKVPIKCPKCGAEFSFIWQFDPHTHLISNVYTRIGTIEAQEALDGDVYKNLVTIVGPNDYKTVRKPSKIGAKFGCQVHRIIADPKTVLKHLSGLIHYELSHALFRENHHALAYCGLFANINWCVNETSVTSDYDDGDGVPFCKTFTRDFESSLRVIMKNIHKPVYTLKEADYVRLPQTTRTIHMWPARAPRLLYRKAKNLWLVVRFNENRTKSFTFLWFGKPVTVEFPYVKRRRKFRRVFLHLPKLRYFRYVVYHDRRNDSSLGENSGILTSVQTLLDGYFQKLPKDKYNYRGYLCPLTKSGKLSVKVQREVDAVVGPVPKIKERKNSAVV